MNLPGHYILVNCVPVEEPDIMKWAMWLENSDRIVAQTKSGAARISTVFLGLDFSWGPGPPLLFETMVFGCPILGHLMSRYSTWPEAEDGHRITVHKVEALTVFN